MKFGVVVFPGSNCDDDMIHVLGTVMGAEVRKIWHKEESLGDLTTDDCVVLPGGFSYGDYVRAGAIARFSPVMQAVIAHANAGGYVWGICNGFQVLCEAGLLPGALLRNANQKFICKNVHLKVATNNSAITADLEPNKAYKIPIAHAEGRFHASPASLQAIMDNDQVLFYYCTPTGEISAAANPNGSAHHIAGICNANRNVFGMMPHPERASEETLGNTDGYGMFASLLAATVT
ncbi:MAG: phosphoribosylformylglycinamidine synthase subunit PurQ [Bacteroidota bacterium]